jgi:hypothetical protein
MLLRELEAFEACWLDLRDLYPTTRQDNTQIAQAMGQLVDRREKPDQVERALPDHLKILFRRLAIAYFQGYFLRPSRQTARPEVGSPLVSSQPTSRQTSDPHPDVIRQQEISDAVAQVKALAKQAQRRMEQARSGQPGTTTQDLDTLVIAFPDDW